MRMRSIYPVLLTLLMTNAGCATFHLTEQTGVLPVQKHRRATNESLAVREFTYESENSRDTPLEALDLLKWRNLVISGLDQANIFANVIPFSLDTAEAPASYVLDGRITRFRFQKNWFPTFFPLHLGLSFFTFSAYTLFGGPTTATLVRFAVEFELRRVETGEIVASFDRNYRSLRAVNIYSKSVENPYDNPNLVFAKILESAAIEIAAALPLEPDLLSNKAPQPTPNR